jgi:glycosyltransferase involved in cell wall biosynthesis
VISSVLWVTDEPPDRKGGGGNIRQSYLVRALAERAEVSLLLVGSLDDDAVRSSLRAVVELQHPGFVVARTDLERRARTLASSLVGRNPSELRRTKKVRELLATELSARHGDYDLVVVLHASTAPVLPDARRQPSAVEFQHLRSKMLEQQRVDPPGRRHAWLWGVEARQAARLEAWAARRYDVAIACSDDDAAELRRAGAREVVVAPNGVNVAHFRPTPVPSSQRLVLPGTLDYEPNIDGVTWFCDEVLPLVRNARPDVELDVVGRRPTAAVRALAERDGIAVHADVPSVQPFVDAARAVIVPIRVGTGTRLKALEAMAAARPVVGTTIGLEGLGIVDGAHALVADAPDLFAAAVVQVLDDDDVARRLAAAGRALVEERFDWDHIGVAYAEALLAAAGRVSPAPSGTRRR